MKYNNNNSSIKLPSNKKFGYFFVLIFLITSGYFFIKNSLIWTLVFISLAAIFILIIFFNPNTLHPLNRMWMKFGTFLGILISPIVLAIIYFGLFTSYSFIMRLFGRDELKLKQKKESYWITRNSFNLNFKQQF
jgi:hypothetical protein